MRTWRRFPARFRFAPIRMPSSSGRTVSGPLDPRHADAEALHLAASVRAGTMAARAVGFRLPRGGGVRREGPEPLNRLDVDACGREAHIERGGRRTSGRPSPRSRSMSCRQPMKPLPFPSPVVSGSPHGVDRLPQRRRIARPTPVGRTGVRGRGDRSFGTAVRIALAQKVGGVQALMTSQGTGPMQRKRCGRRLSK